MALTQPSLMHFVRCCPCAAAIQSFAADNNTQQEHMQFVGLMTPVLNCTRSAAAVQKPHELQCIQNVEF